MREIIDDFGGAVLEAVLSLCVISVLGYMLVNYICY